MNKLNIQIDVREGSRVIGMTIPKDCPSKTLYNNLKTFLLAVGWPEKEVREYFGEEQ